MLNLNTKCALLFGGTINIIGWFFLMGIIVSDVIPESNVVQSILFMEELTQARGEVTAVTQTNKEDGDEWINQISFQFTDQNGARWYDYSYETDTSYKKGDIVAVEYKANSPKTARIEGLRSQPYPITSFLISLSVGIGSILCIFFGLKKGMKNLYLITHGVVVEGHFVSENIERAGFFDLFAKEDLHLKRKHNYIYQYQFHPTKNQKIIASGKAFSEEWIKHNKPKTQIIYLADHPEQNGILSLILGNITLNQDNVPQSDSHQWLWEPIMGLTTVFVIIVKIML